MGHPNDTTQSAVDDTDESLREPEWKQGNHAGCAAHRTGRHYSMEGGCDHHLRKRRALRQPHTGFLAICTAPRQRGRSCARSRGCRVGRLSRQSRFGAGISDAVWSQWHRRSAHSVAWGCASTVHWRTRGVHDGAGCDHAELRLADGVHKLCGACGGTRWHVPVWASRGRREHSPYDVLSCNGCGKSRQGNERRHTGHRLWRSRMGAALRCVRGDRSGGRVDAARASPPSVHIAANRLRPKL